MPALLTRMSTLPNCFFVSAKSFAHFVRLREIGLHGDGLARRLVLISLDDSVGACPCWTSS